MSLDTSHLAHLLKVTEDLAAAENNKAVSSVMRQAGERLLALEAQATGKVARIATLEEALAELVGMYRGVCANLPIGVTSKAEIERDLAKALAALAKTKDT